MAKKPETRADLHRKIAELHAQLACTYAFASRDLHKAGTPNLMASGVLLQLNALGGRELIPPVLIRDGLSPDTITALQRDITRSFEGATALKPKA